MKRSAGSVLSMLVAVALAASAMASSQTPSGETITDDAVVQTDDAVVQTDDAVVQTDDAVVQMLAKRLERRGLEDVDVRLDGNSLVLTGTVDNLREKMEAERVARGFEEIESIDNRIELAPNDRVEADIVAEVRRKLGNPTWHTVFDWVEANVQGSSVILEGDVTMPWKERSAIRAMQSIPGVDTVVSNIEVLPVSIHDDQIRQRAYEAIYGDLAFSEFANRIDPPIHIVVDSGDVRLEGSVRNRAEKMLAHSLVSGSALAFDIQNNLQVSSEQPS